MTTCLKQIRDRIKNHSFEMIQGLFPNTVQTFEVTTEDNALFVFETSKYETVRFILSCASVIEGMVTDVDVNFYEYQASNQSVTFLGGVKVFNRVLDFQQDFDAGIHVICISSTLTDYQCGIKAIYSGFTPYVKIGASGSMGSEMSVNLRTERPKVDCGETIYFKILEGSLPPGLTMDPLGVIRGTVSNLDCIEDLQLFSPSVNWAYDIAEETHSWALAFKFKVKAYILSYPKAQDTRWFQIRVYNNWDWDRDNFLEEIRARDAIILEPLPPIEELPEVPELCCNIEYIPPEQKLQEIPVSACPCPVESNTTTKVDLSTWYVRNQLGDKTKMSPEMLRFISAVSETDSFKDLENRFGLTEDTMTLEERNESVILNTMKEIDDTPKDSMKPIRDNLNQSLPTTCLSYSGSCCSFELEVKYGKFTKH